MLVPDTICMTCECMDWGASGGHAMYVQVWWSGDAVVLRVEYGPADVDGGDWRWRS